MDEEKFKCTKCKCEHFYHRAGFVYCLKCHQLYSAPSQGEMEKMIRTNAFEPLPREKPKEIGLFEYYERMNSFKDFYGN